MNQKRLGAAMLAAMLAMSPIGWAQEMAAVDMGKIMMEIKDMRRDYEAKIASLQAEVNALKRGQHIADPKAVQDAPAEEKSGISVEYVGRQEGPFQKGGLVATDNGGFGNVSLGGYADIELENFQDKHSTFDQHRFVLNVGAEIGERLRFFSEYEIEHGGPDASGSGSAKVEQAWIEFLIHEAINFRAGAVLVPFGRYNIYHDSDLNDLTDRPLLARDIIPTTWTEAGAGFHGQFNPKIGDYEDLQLTYEAYMINGLNAGITDTGLRGARGSLQTDNNNDKAIVSRITASPALGHEFGLSGYIGDFNGEDDNIMGIGIDFLSTWGPWEFLGEWALFNAGDGDGVDNLTGGYIQANYHFWFDFLNDSFLGRTFDNPTFTLVGRYGFAHIDDDADVTLNDNQEQRFTVGLNYRPVESWVLKLEYQNNRTQQETLERGDAEGFIASIAMGF